MNNKISNITLSNCTRPYIMMVKSGWVCVCCLTPHYRFSPIRYDDDDDDDDDCDEVCFALERYA